MSSEKQSFILYIDLSQHIKKLPIEEVGLLFLGIFHFMETGEIPALSGATEMCFSFIKAQIDRDTNKWVEIRTKRAEAGKVGGIASGAARKQSQANESSASVAKQVETTEAVTVYVPVSVHVPGPVPTTECIEINRQLNSSAQAFSDRSINHDKAVRKSGKLQIEQNTQTDSELAHLIVNLDTVSPDVVS